MPPETPTDSKFSMAQDGFPPQIRSPYEHFFLHTHKHATVMKLYYASTLLLIVLTAVTAKNIDKNGMDLDKVGVRVLLNQGKESNEGFVCDESDQLLLQATLFEILPLTRHLNLREGGQHGRELVNCREVCRGFPRGQCYLVYSECWGYRRELESNDEEEKELTRRFLENDVSIEASEKCGGLKKQVEAQIVKIITQVQGLSLSCLGLAEEKMTVSCVLMD